MAQSCTDCGYDGPNLLEHVSARIAFGACPVESSRAKTQATYDDIVELLKSGAIVCERRSLRVPPKNGKTS